MVCVKMNLIFAFSILIILTQSVNGDLSKRLKAYETLHFSDLQHHHVSKRSIYHAPDVHARQRVVTFSVLGRKFKLHLERQTSLFSKEFKAVIQHRNSSSSQVVIDPNDFYAGYVVGESHDSKVRAYFEDDNLVASIWSQDDVYTVEPSWRHLPSSEKYTMIAYKASDMIKDKKIHPEAHVGESFCGFVKPDHDEAAYVYDTPDSSKDQNKNNIYGNRKKRQASSLTTCALMLVADYHFYEEVGASNEVIASKYLIGVLSRVDAIYRATDFGSGYQGLGFELKGLLIHDAATSGYNAPQNTWDVTNLLNEFSKENWDDYCLAHLFTYLAFSDGVLGLGWVASKQANAAGGICTPVANNMYYNTAWTSLSNKYGNRLLTQESDLVTAHGHNWGSQHDPATSECSPAGADGNFLMYTYAVSGYSSNNNNFSPCSKRTILEVLQSKSDNCFQEPSTSFCGNLVVEEDEQCDAGTDGSQGNDPCCDASCRFKGDATCSDANSVCCSECQFTAADVVCSGSAENNITCEAPAKCNGLSAECPAAASKVNGSACIDDGECFSGQCLAKCEANGLISCICDEGADSCKVCCKSASSTCEVFNDNGASYNLTDGKTCYIGVCLAGKCEKETRSGGNRQWSVIEDLSIDSILVFMKNNVVLATIILSLIIYIPLCIIVFVIDRKREKNDKEEVEWRNKDNDKLLSDKDNKLIRPSTRVYPRRPRGPPSTATASRVEVAAF